eukprot:TRINITY_DN12615_c0_g1_i1.p1 TRINITY_DN12615_c0_g1~~TRINITY_DN12615_c0_g1_i1.p1  ORF type:complete len:315 (-),score=68.26 TRINITY_DN12615_c0_g1_i1:245-1189(-)
MTLLRTLLPRFGLLSRHSPRHNTQLPSLTNPPPIRANLLRIASPLSTRNVHHTPTFSKMDDQSDHSLGRNEATTSNAAFTPLQWRTAIREKSAHQHRSESLRLYRRLLRAAHAFFDNQTREFLILRIKALYRRHRHVHSLRIQLAHLADARSHLRRLLAANSGDHQHAKYFLSHAYALTGRLAHMLNKPLLPPTATSKNNKEYRWKKEKTIIVQDVQSGVRVKVDELLKRKGKPGRHHPRPLLPKGLSNALEDNLKSRDRWKQRLFRSIVPVGNSATPKFPHHVDVDGSLLKSIERSSHKRHESSFMPNTNNTA